MPDIKFTKNDNALICTLHGRIGTEICESLSKSLFDAVESYQKTPDEPENLRVSIDMQGVDFIASSFIRICISMSRKLNQDNFSIINASPMIKKTFKIAGLDEILNVS